MNDRLRIAMIVLLAVGWIGSAAKAQQSGPPPPQDRGAHHREMMEGRGRGTMGMNQDGSAMAQMRDIHGLFMNHDRITRTVTNLPNGIRTVTESTDPRVAQLLKDHVTGSDRRVATGDDPQLPVESDALRLIYKNHEIIRTTLEPTDAGIAVVQTSSDANTVAALQQHAAEVTEFVKEGMPAMHKAMMKNGRGMRGRGVSPEPR